MVTGSHPDDLAQLRDERGFDAFAKELSRQHGESAARDAFATRTADELTATSDQNRQHREEWRSTPEGETDYQAVCARVLAKVESKQADDPARATG